MKFRKLRIAWSAIWSLVAVLLVVLWVRSYWWSYTLSAYDGHIETGLGIEGGGAGAAYGGVPKLSQLRFGWSIDAITADADVQSQLGFYFGPHPADPDFSLVVIPLWLFVLTAVAVAALSWKRTLRLGFSLRTLLIATTLVAAILGMLVFLERTE